MKRVHKKLDPDPYFFSLERSDPTPIETKNEPISLFQPIIVLWYMNGAGWSKKRKLFGLIMIRIFIKSIDP